MNIKNIYRILIVLFLCTISAKAQEVLTIEEAMKIALENNFEIKIAKNNSTINNKMYTISTPMMNFGIFFRTIKKNKLIVNKNATILKTSFIVIVE